MTNSLELQLMNLRRQVQDLKGTLTAIKDALRDLNQFTAHNIRRLDQRINYLEDRYVELLEEPNGSTTDE